MATKTHPLYSNFSSGEISPKIDSRIDLAQYFNGAQEIKNWLCVPQGGVKTRGGFHFVAEAKDSGIARFIPFCFSELQNYMLLFGEEYIWFFMNRGIITSDIFPAVLSTIDFTRDSVSWPTCYIPTDELRVTTNNAPMSNASWGGVTSGFGGTRLTGRVIPANLPYKIETPYRVLDDLWSIRFAQDDENLYLVHPLYPPMVLTKGIGHTAFTITEMEFIDGPYLDVVETTTITPSDTTGDVTLTASDNLFLEGHVGAFWRLNHAGTWSHVIITGVTSSTVATATVLSTTTAGATTTHREGAWSDVNGYPRQICFHEGRMIFASTYEQPQTVWGSKTGKYTDFTPGILDNDAYSFTPSDLNIIRWILPGRRLSIGALNTEATAVGPSDGPITAADPPTIKSETTHGSSDLISPVRVGKAILFLQRAARKIREFVYSYADDAYGAPDVTLASEHLFVADIIDLVYQQEPESVLWAIRNDTTGYFIACTYDRMMDPTKGGIVAWTRQYTDGIAESFGVMPYQEQDQLWALFNRTIGGVSKRYVEYYDPDICVDSGLTWDGGLVTILGGLQHLAGKTVQIVGDGAVYPSQVVPANGELTISPGMLKGYVGLGYTPRLVTNRPEVPPAGGGTSQGLKKRWNKITAKVLNTIGITINGQIIPARVPADLMGSAPGTYSGELDITNLGWDREGRITIEQPLPLKAHIVSIGGTLTVGDD